MSVSFLFSKNIAAEEKTYVTCMLWGELGNQMFEIANTVSYARDHGCEPVFWGFNQAAAGEVNYRYVFHRVNVIDPKYSTNFINYEHPYSNPKYSPIPFDPGKNLRFCGHYQNEKYFAHHRDEILKLFAPTPKILEKINRKYSHILKQKTVAVHVRSFITSARHPDHDGFAGASWEYFIDAMNHFPDDYTFVVFSDAPQWTKAHFPRVKSKIVFVQGNPHYIDLYFISLCDHQIVSPDSTFSWWGAWLNTNPDKVVIVPHYWQVTVPGEYVGGDAHPENWIRIQAKNKFGF